MKYETKWVKLMLRAMCLAAVLLSGCERDTGAALNTANAGQLPMSSMAGKWVLLNYWAEWCKPCLEEIPQLNQFAKQHTADVVMLGINYDAVTGDVLQQQLQRAGIQYPVLLALPPALASRAMPRGLPTTLLLNAQWQVVAELEGPQSVASLENALLQHKAPGQQ